MPDNNQQYGPVDSVGINDIDQPNKKHSYRMIIITVIVILIAIGGYIISQNENLQQTMKRTLTGGQGGETTTGQPIPMLEVSSIESRDRAWIEIVPEMDTVSLDGIVKLTVKGFSEGKDISGYDLLITLDSEIFEFGSVSSAIPGFTVFPFDNGQYIAITAIKDIGQNEPTILNETDMLTIELKPKKKGTGLVSVALENDKEKTQLVDVDVQVLTPQVGSTQIQIN